MQQKKNKGYKHEYAEQAYKLCLLGCSLKEITSFFSVSQKVFRNWVAANEALADAIQSGMQLADAAVAERLYQKAIGYTHEVTTVCEIGKEDKITHKSYPPDTAAAIFWLRNRQRDKWRDKKETDTITDTTIDVKVQD